MSLTLTTWGHSAVRLERDGRRLAVDPGTFSDLAVLDSAEAVLLTHEHPDHIAVEPLVAALAARSGLTVSAPESVAALLREAGASAGQVVAVAPGEELRVAGLAVEVLGGTHAPVHPSLPAMANNAYLIEGAVLHPGDSFTTPPPGRSVDVLLLPVAAPWLKLAESVDYAREVGARTVVPIHDAVLNDAGKALADRVAGSLVAPSTYRRLAVGESFEVPLPG